MNVLTRALDQLGRTEESMITQSSILSLAGQDVSS